MENDSVRTSGDATLVDMWIEGKLRSISLSRGAIETYLRLPADRAAAVTDDERREFVRTNLGLVVTAAKDRLRATDADADVVEIEAGQLGGHGRAQPAPREGERRTGDRRKGDRRKANVGPPPSGERRRS
ncbi:MAG: hypothetical protein ACJ8EV_08215 [Sphingomicrobium sp.]